MPNDNLHMSAPIPALSSALASYTPPRIPENHFLRWLSERMIAKDIELNFAYSECRFLMDFIDDSIVKKYWKPQTPVFISAQTGAGKNTFIHKVLIDKIIIDSQQREDKVLLLCNRIALSRQSKYEASKKVRYATIAHMDDLSHFNEDGIDKACHEFGPLHIYTYHQIHNNSNIDFKKYKYIVCDECHFFTSDSRFFAETNEILKRIVREGQDAIRIYMSATPEVAFEAIIREEYDSVLRNRISIENKFEDDFRNSLLQADEVRTENEKNLQLAINWLNHPDTNETMRVNYLQEYNQALDNLNALNPENLRRICYKNYQEEMAAQKLPVNFYCMAKNYDYIQEIKTFKKDAELIDEITSDKSLENKWVIFVHSKSMGENLCDKLNGKDKKSKVKEQSEVPEQAIFISATNKGNDPEPKSVFDKIAANAKFDKRILITTSVLDNGINIKDTSVRNVAIDIYDRTEFIQMLGRVRVDSGDKINLYIREYDVEKLKSFAKDAAFNLIYRLMIDYCDSGVKMGLYDQALRQYNRGLDRHLYRISDSSALSIEYNPCAIYQLIDYLSNLIFVIRKAEPDFCIEYSNFEDEKKREQLVDYYTNSDGRDKPWSRSIVDILGSKYDREKRTVYEEEDTREGISYPRYPYTMTDTFINYLYQDVVPHYIYKTACIEAANMYFSKIPDENEHKREIDRFQALRTRLKDASQYSTYSDLELWKLMFDGRRSQFSPQTLSVVENLIHESKNKIDHYIELASGSIENPTDVQYQWIEKKVEKHVNGSICSETQLNRNIEDMAIIKETEANKDIVETKFSRNIEDMATTEEEIKKNKHGANYFDIQFLKAHGVYVKSDETTDDEKSFKEKYKISGLLSEYLTKEIVINFDGKNTKYRVLSRRANSHGHPTYYLFIKVTEHDESPANE